MIQKRIYLRPDDESVYLDTYCPRMYGGQDTLPRPVMLILPGGGYEYVSLREGEPLALRLLPEGFSSFVLYYSVGEMAKYPRPLQDVSIAVCHIREHAEEYNIDPDKIFVTGSSAGGHLAAAYGTFWNTDMASFPGMAKGVNKPLGAAPNYPVISAEPELTHKPSFDHMCGSPDATLEERRAFDPSLHVNSDTVPMFLWHCANDTLVPVNNSIRMANALWSAGIECELHIYPEGGHGIALATPETACGGTWGNPAIAKWVDAMVMWTRRYI